jgi:GTP diphosphokinase / guanosine-3',5'-bis(diphosphate) 3'-diphosphatase
MLIGTFEKRLDTSEEQIRYIREHFLAKELDLVERVYAFAKAHYTHITHPTAKPFVEYALHVATLLTNLGANAAIVAAALLYPPPSLIRSALDDLEKVFKGENELIELVKDVLHIGDLEWDVWSAVSEQSEAKERREILRKMFLLATDKAEGEDQAQDISRVTHFQKQEKQVENLIRMFLVAATDYRALIIKLADRLYLMKLLKDLPQAQRESLHYTQLAKITLAVYAPLADRLGIWQLKPELEDLSFRLLEPKKYLEIAREFDQKRHERKYYITHTVIPELRAKLVAFGIDAEISGRAKHIYSIYQKMEAKQLTFDKINDLLGVRIIVQSLEECYEAQSILHAFWHPVTDVYDGKAGRDWIAHPKENDYQSLHTTIYFQQKDVEVQIRTHEMHEVAEYGADAAHWRYKARKAYRRGKTAKETRTKEQTWNSQLAEKRRTVKLAEGSITPQQRDLLKKWIFVITPQGHVIDLKYGSTPLDFAYRIHTDLGHRYTGAKVDKQIVRLDYELKNGEIVELITSRARKGPNPNWLARSKDKDGNDNYLVARTPTARKKIHSWLNKHKPKEQLKKDLS